METPNIGQSKIKPQGVPFTDFVESGKVKYVLVSGTWYEIEVGSFKMRPGTPFIKFTAKNLQANGVILNVEIFPTALEGWAYDGQ